MIRSGTWQADNLLSLKRRAMVVWVKILMGSRWAGDEGCAVRRYRMKGREATRLVMLQNEKGGVFVDVVQLVLD